ncbi:hypothetical protein V5O48_000578 [Marasmius crinis-equi]|uniref:Uncharacterized protein n=1 Tax=Marasmius crinis-equi TaxID=585013 RepID=A0ABR3G0U9_9AGAR
MSEIPARRRAKPYQRNKTYRYIKISTLDVAESPEDYIWYTRAGRTPLPFKLETHRGSVPAGTKLRKLNAYFLEKAYAMYGTMNTNIRTFYDGLADYILKNYNWDRVIVPFGCTYRGKQIYQVLDKGWMEWTLYAGKCEAARERFPLFFRALEQWLDRPRHYNAIRDTGESTYCPYDDEAIARQNSRSRRDHSEDSDAETDDELDENGYSLKDGFIEPDDPMSEGSEEEELGADVGEEEEKEDGEEIGGDEEEREQSQVRKSVEEWEELEPVQESTARVDPQPRPLTDSENEVAQIDSDSDLEPDPIEAFVVEDDSDISDSAEYEDNSDDEMDDVDSGDERSGRVADQSAEDSDSNSCPDEPVSSRTRSSAQEISTASAVQLTVVDCSPSKTPVSSHTRSHIKGNFLSSTSATVVGSSCRTNSSRVARKRGHSRRSNTSEDKGQVSPEPSETGSDVEMDKGGGNERFFSKPRLSGKPSTPPEMQRSGTSSSTAVDSLFIRARSSSPPPQKPTPMASLPISDSRDSDLSDAQGPSDRSGSAIRKHTGSRRPNTLYSSANNEEEGGEYRSRRGRISRRSDSDSGVEPLTLAGISNSADSDDEVGDDSGDVRSRRAVDRSTEDSDSSSCSDEPVSSRTRSHSKGNSLSATVVGSSCRRNPSRAARKQRYSRPIDSSEDEADSTSPEPSNAGPDIEMDDGRGNEQVLSKSITSCTPPEMRSSRSSSLTSIDSSIRALSPSPTSRGPTPTTLLPLGDSEDSDIADAEGPPDTPSPAKRKRTGSKGTKTVHSSSSEGEGEDYRLPSPSKRSRISRVDSEDSEVELSTPSSSPRKQTRQRMVCVLIPLFHSRRH